MERIIFHIDMDAFFASVEQSSNPNLKGKPVAVIGSGKRTVVTAASYEARAYGVKTGMTVYEAKRKCPFIKFVVGDRNKYIYTCEKLNKLYLKYTPFVEMYSIDESFLDMTHLSHKGSGIVKIAEEIKNSIKKKFGISCSIGIAPNKLLAKLVSDLSKPNGIFFLRSRHVGKFMENLPVDLLCGVGKSIAGCLRSLGIRDCRSLAEADIRLLKKYFGVNGYRLILMGKGIDSSSVKYFDEEDEVKSIGHSTTFDRDIYSFEEAEKYLLKLSDMVSERLRKGKYWGKLISVSVRFSDFTAITRQRALKEHIQDTHSIFYWAKNVFLEKIKFIKPIRLLGISVGRLAEREYQKDFFKDYEKIRRFFNSIDEISYKFGEDSVRWASLIESPGIPKVLSPSFRCKGVRRY